MQNIEEWKSSKFEFRKDKLYPSSDPKIVNVSSWIMVKLIADFYLKNIAKYLNGHLLDLGCGNVPLYEVYKPYINNNICVDWENTIHKNQYLDFNADLNKTLPLKDNTFDSLILSDVLEHIKEPKLLWNEMARVLKKNGVIILNTPFYYSLHEEPYDYYRFTKFALIKHAEEAGFEVISIEALGGAPEIFADLLAKLGKHIPFIGSTFAYVVQKLTWWFCKTKIGKKISQRTSKKFPYAYGLIAKKS